MFLPGYRFALKKSRKRKKKKRKRFLLMPNPLERSKGEKKRGGLYIFWSCPISYGMSFRTSSLEWKLSNMIDGFSCYLQVENSENRYFFHRPCCLLVQELFPLCCRIDLQHQHMSLYIFLTSPSWSITQQAFCGMMDCGNESLMTSFAIKDCDNCH